MFSVVSDKARPCFGTDVENEITVKLSVSFVLKHGAKTISVRRTRRRKAHSPN